jgi:hypothetical protein
VNNDTAWTSLPGWTPWLVQCQHQWKLILKRRQWAGSDTMDAPDWYDYRSRIERCWLCGAEREVAE